MILISLLWMLLQLPPPNLPNAPEQAPIDGGLGLLAAAGCAYAWRRLRKPEKP
jgi:hypothetical protein